MTSLHLPASSTPPASAWTATAEPLPATRALEGDRRADVVVLDAAEPGWGASGRNGGQVIPGLKDDPDELERKFGPETGRRMWQLSGGAAGFVFELIARHKISCHA